MNLKYRIVYCSIVWFSVYHNHALVLTTYNPLLVSGYTPQHGDIQSHHSLPKLMSNQKVWNTMEQESNRSLSQKGNIFKFKKSGLFNVVTCQKPQLKKTTFKELFPKRVSVYGTGGIHLHGILYSLCPTQKKGRKVRLRMLKVPGLTLRVVSSFLPRLNQHSL